MNTGSQREGVNNNGLTGVKDKCPLPRGTGFNHGNWQTGSQRRKISDRSKSTQREKWINGTEIRYRQGSHVITDGMEPKSTTNDYKTGAVDLRAASPESEMTAKIKANEDSESLLWHLPEAHCIQSRSPSDVYRRPMGW